MRRFACVVFFIALMAASAVARQNYYYYDNRPVNLNLVDDQISVRFDQAVTDSEARSLLRSVLGAELRELRSLAGPATRLVVLQNRSGESRVSDLINNLRRLPAVKMAAPVFQRGGIRNIIHDRFIARFQPGLERDAIEAIATPYNVDVVGQLAKDTWILSARKQSGLDGLSGANLFHELSETVWASPDFLYVDGEIMNSNDTYYDQQWALNNAGQEVPSAASEGFPSTVKGFAGADTDAERAWEFVRTQGTDPGAGIIVGVLDSGIDLDHPDLSANIVDPGRDFTYEQNENGNDSHGHGTAVAGIIAAQTDNGIGVAGLAYKAGLLPAKMMTREGASSSEDIAEAIDYAWQFGCDILSNSWSSDTPDEVVADAIRRAYTQGRDGKGCLIVFSSGNKGHGIVDWPGAMEEVVSVSASNMFDEKKNQGSRDNNRKWGGNYGDNLDLVAPTAVYTTDITGKDGFEEGDYNPTFGGTSASCPHVSAVAAIALSVNPSLSAGDLEQVLFESADPIERYPYNSKGWNRHVGFGRVNAYNAARSAASQDGNTPVLAFEHLPTTTSIDEVVLNVDAADDNGFAEMELFFRPTLDGEEGAWQNVTGKQGASGWEFRIPGQQWGTEVDYYLSVEDGGGNRLTMPANGEGESPPPLHYTYFVGETEKQNFSAPDVPLSWDDWGIFYTSTISVDDNATVTDVEATVTMNGAVDQFAVNLAAPSQIGAGILQLNEGREYSNTTVDDEATTLLVQGQAPYSGTFLPDNAMWTMDGENSNGDWTLTIYDDYYFSNGGTLSDWTLSLTLLQKNPAPVVSGIPGETINEGGSFKQIYLGEYVSDENHSSSEMTWTSSGNSDLVVTIDAEHVATIETPDDDWYGSETITFTATDPGGASGSQAVTFTVNNVNDAPQVSQIPNQTVDEGTPFATIKLDEYVSDVDNSDEEMQWSYSGNKELLVSISPERVATVSVPDDEWSGSERITFTATDPGNLADQTTATFTVNPVNDPPAVSGIADQQIDEGGSFVTIALNEHVSDPDNADSEISWTYSGNNELNVSIDENNVATVSIPGVNWNGSETITFTATDPGGLSDSDAATFTVNAVNDAPTVSRIADQTIDEGGSFATIDLNNHVSDVDNDDSEMTWEAGGQKELIVTIDANNIATIETPNADWNGSETITFTATDPGNLSDSDDAVFTVNSINDAPQVSDIPNQEIDEGESFATIPLNNYVDDADHDDSEISWTYSGNSDLGVTINENNIATISAPHGEWAGSEAITFTATDPEESADSDAATFTVIAVNDAPVVSNIPNQSIAEGENFATIALDGYVSDADHGDDQMEWSYSGNEELTVTIDDNRVATIGIPDAQWNGSETITFTATDPGGLSDSDAAVFSVGAENDPPTVSNIPGQTINEGQSFVTISLDDFVEDPDNADSEMSWQASGNTDLSVTINADRVATISVPDENWNGSEMIMFTATDPGGLSDSDDATFTVNAVNDAPVVSGIPDQTILEGGSFTTIALDDYVSDVDNADSEMSWKASGNTDLSVTIDANRVATVSVPNANWNGSETITFTASDPGKLEDSDNATFTVKSENDAPVVSDIPDQNITEGQSFATIPLDNYVSDNDDPDSAISWFFSGNSALDVSIDGNRVATISAPNANWNGSETITFTAEDPGGLSDSDEATFSISAENDAPVVSAIADQTIMEGAAFATISLDNFVSDVDNADSEITWTFYGQSDLQVDLNGERMATIIIPDEDWFGSETITFRAADPSGLADSSTAFFTVTPVNDPPAIVDFPDTLAFDNDKELALDLQPLMEDVDSGRLLWHFALSDTAVKALYDSSLQKLTLSAPGFDGLALLYSSLSDDSGAVAHDTAIVMVEDIVSDMEGDRTAVPTAFSLEQNYPNPFNPSTTIRYNLPRSAKVLLTLYDMRGRKIMELQNSRQPAGSHKIVLDASGLSSGVYFYVFKAEGFMQARKLVLLR